VLRRLGVVGWPVGHSRSPDMHNAALEAVGLRDWRYQLLPVPPEVFEETVRALPAAGFRGVNVTIPHKEAALGLATEPTPRARAIGAANTLLFAGEEGEGGGVIEADNTDAPALIEALPFPPTGRTAMVLGAGGSARAAVWALLNAGAAEVWVWNRTPERAQALTEQLGGASVDSSRPADILVHCTSTGLDGQNSTFKQLPVAADALGRYDCVVDLVYTPHGTALVRAARERGAAVVDGLDLLVRQGALSFERFTGRPAPLDVMRAAAGSDG
jgi:shikimate dehydrogenase